MASTRRTFLSTAAAAAVAAPLVGTDAAHADGRRPGQAPDPELREILREIDP